MRSRTALAASGGAVLVGLIAASWAAGYALGEPVPAAIASSTAPVAAASTPAVTASAKPTPTATRTRTAAPVARTCSVAAAARDPRLHSFQGQVRNARTGEVLFDRGGSKASRAASVMKVLTSAAALEVLGPDHRLTTKVVQGSRAGEIVLVGGGDPTLSRTPAGTTTAYAGAPHLSTLARQVKAAWKAKHPGQRITRIVLDASYFGGPTWQPTWDLKERRLGSTPKITALMVDGDRANPALNTSPRGSDPIGRAGAAFASYFGGGVTVVRGTAPSGAAVLGTVRSQPVGTLVQQELIVSDNTIAEALARVTAIEAGAGNTFSAIDAAVVPALQAYGIAPTGVRVVDGSGLSDDNRIPPSYLTKLFVKVLHRSGGLGPVFDGLPIAGRTGSLAYSDRFSGAASRADGKVRAKTGWIDSGYTLAGIIRAKDGTPLTFAFYALGPPIVSSTAKQALDSLTADVWSCGKRLSNR
ncbi:D-alanyl-D-alanine carboxypeptidase/D-alanyl-D-alanine-endopeptidase [Amnibacterium kyonggiense]|uniref:D-alanyl-D-alanine carboxypeptidase/D-alanyl-D-alanine-endopeptidase (Penicillin-binding protein 4) n=1 Tax=Amnibacterium kyonggiense TaxID=595671 RepID=A0A4R7FHZ2_9MICO|nr:D-alanyl-D-alanine carboxypeptidase [Amnibacterium kyonggiense]TDS75057.1 D-alanyl-D-alanine carboxypeptidase/D-alanyl-D-alanine-endopeptidase (penicillin-binding protein 4) [Amnibacterium kyonggiense]